MQNENVVLGVAWFQPDQWEQLKRIADDRDALDDSYVEWKRNAHAAISDFRAAGKTVRKVNVEIDELVVWCQARHIPLNASARAEFVTEKLQARYRA